MQGCFLTNFQSRSIKFKLGETKGETRVRSSTAVRRLGQAGTADRRRYRVPRNRRGQPQRRRSGVIIRKRFGYSCTLICTRGISCCVSGLTAPNTCTAGGLTHHARTAASHTRPSPKTTRQNGRHRRVHGSLSGLCFGIRGFKLRL